MALFPTTAGRHVIGPAILRCEVQEAPELDPDDPFSLFRGAVGTMRQVKLQTDPITIQAEPLPGQLP